MKTLTRTMSLTRCIAKTINKQGIVIAPSQCIRKTSTLSRGTRKYSTEHVVQGWPSTAVPPSAVETPEKPKAVIRAPRAIRPRIVVPAQTLSDINSADLRIEVDGKVYTYDNIFLRDLCPCPKCIDPSTRQKLFNTTDLDLDGTHPVSITVKSKGPLEIAWGEPDGRQHISHYDADLLLRYSTKERKRRFRSPFPTQVYWDGDMMRDNVLRVDYETFLKDNEMMHRVLLHLHLYGLAYFVNIPSISTDGAEISTLASRIGEIKQTFYGKTWDVKSVPQSKNIAYTNLNLGLHMDLMYYNSPPGLQFLHCMRNTVTGGSSIFVDSFRAATLLRIQSMHDYKSLVNTPVPFHYINDNRHYYFSRPTIVPDLSDPYSLAIDHVNYSPPFQAPFELSTTGKLKPNWRRFLQAFKKFADICEREDMQFEETLKEGECVVFSNRRVLHARRAFDTTSGDRWLKGTYVDWDDFQVTTCDYEANDRVN